MIVEQRRYTLKPGQVSEYFAVYEAEGYDVQARHLGKPVGYYHSETGILNQIIHMWQYEDAADRQQRRAALYSDPSWQGLVKRLFPLIETMESQILNPAPFFTLAAVPKPG